MSCAGVVGYAFEAFDSGLIEPADLGGLHLRWGSGASLVGLVERIGRRQGDLARLLGEGSRRAADQLGGAEYTHEVKGLEIAFHDPRAHVSMAANYATASRGACHLDSLSYFIGRGTPAPDLGYTSAFVDHDSTPEMARLCYVTQNYQAMFNPLGLCKFLFVGQIGPSILARWYTLATGNELDQEGFMETGERLLQLKRLYNARVGVRRADDTLPRRLLTLPQPDGAAAGVLPDLDVMLPELYRLRGWDDDGVPTDETVRRFGLEAFAS
jgi:aldehyde:ferredoxin oxidoreductase